MNRLARGVRQPVLWRARRLDGVTVRGIRHKGAAPLLLWIYPMASLQARISLDRSGNARHWQGTFGGRHFPA
jgi:hypothetical protein